MCSIYWLSFVLINCFIFYRLKFSKIHSNSTVEYIALWISGRTDGLRGLCNALSATLKLFSPVSETLSHAYESLIEMMFLSKPSSLTTFWLWVTAYWLVCMLNNLCSSFLSNLIAKESVWRKMLTYFYINSFFSFFFSLFCFFFFLSMLNISHTNIVFCVF